MSTTLSAHGGGAQPARIDSSGKVTGGAAMRVYGFASEAEAQAAGYVCEGGPAMSVALITDAQLASGEWKLDGDPFAVVIYTAPDSLPTEGGFAVPVYAVNGWGAAPVPPSGPVPLLDLEADTGITAYSTPFAGAGTITQSGTTVTGVGVEFGGTVVAGDRITSSGNGIDGIVQSITSGSELELDTSATVAVGVAYTITPQAASLRVTGWTGQEADHHVFTQDQIIRMPVLRTVGGIKMLFFDAFWDYRHLAGTNFLDNLSEFTIVAVGNAIDNATNIVICKAGSQDSYHTWTASIMGTLVGITGNVDPVLESVLIAGTWIVDTVRHIFASTFINSSPPTGSVYVDGALTETTVSGDHISDYSNAEPVRIGQPGDLSQGASMNLCAIRVYSPALSSTDRAAVEAELAARYGITL